MGAGAGGAFMSPYWKNSQGLGRRCVFSHRCSERKFYIFLVPISFVKHLLFSAPNVNGQ